MPRVHKTASGAPAQSSTPVIGQTYGDGVEQQQMAQAMPAPNNRAVEPVAMPQAAPQSAPAAAGTPSIQQLIELAQGQGAGAGILTQPTARPDEPVTTGLPIGPGAGLEAIGFQAGVTPGQRFLRNLATSLGGSEGAFLQGLADRVAR